MSDPPLDAGAFSAWLADLQAAVGGARGSDVPCGSCTACCTASQFIQVGPDETDTLAHIPRGLRFPAPGLPAGHVVLGHAADGRCPMLRDGACSIYAHRPRACRTYDCRVFAAAGVDVDVDARATRAPLARQAGRWRFTYPEPVDQRRHDAVRAAARFLRAHAGALDGAVPPNATGLAVVALALCDAFFDGAVPALDALRARISLR